MRKKIYLLFSFIPAFCGLIIAFENIMIPANGLMIFFESISTSLFFPLIFVLLIGGISGFFLGLAFSQIGGKNGSEDDGGYDL